MNIDDLIFTELKRAHAEISEITDSDAIAAGNEENVLAVNTILRLSRIARKEGLLSLEEAAQNMDDSIMKEALLLVVDGTDPKLLAQIMCFKNAALNLKAFDTITYWIKVYGALCIQSGYNPRIVEELLLGMLTFEGNKRFKEYIEEEERKAAAEYDARTKDIVTKHWVGIEDYVEINRLTEAATGLFEDLDDKCVQRILSDTDNYELVTAMKILSPSAKHRIFSNLSQRLSVMIAEQFDAVGPVRMDDAEAALRSIMKRAVKLEYMCEIVIGPNTLNLVQEALDSDDF